MSPIAARLTDQEEYAKWAEKAGAYCEQLTNTRDNAIALLDHADPVARLSAIESFWNLWHFDEPVARKFVALATGDCNTIVRYSAAVSLTLMHLRCHDSADRLLLEDMLDTVAEHEQPVPEIESDIVGYLENMRTGGEQRLRAQAPAST